MMSPAAEERTQQPGSDVNLLVFRIAQYTIFSLTPSALSPNFTEEFSKSG